MGDYLDVLDKFFTANKVLDDETMADCWYLACRDIRLLRHLHANGVDNWEGYSRPAEEDY